jgi:hypothetical protein
MPHVGPGRQLIKLASSLGQLKASIDLLLETSSPISTLVELIEDGNGVAAIARLALRARMATNRSTILDEQTEGRSDVLGKQVDSGSSVFPATITED